MSPESRLHRPDHSAHKTHLTEKTISSGHQFLYLVYIGTPWSHRLYAGDYIGFASAVYALDPDLAKNSHVH